MTKLFEYVLRAFEKSGLKIYVEENVPLSRKTSFKTGGVADAGVYPESVEDFSAALDVLRTLDIPVYVMGRGSNLLVNDNGFRGAVVFTERLASVDFDGNTVTVGAGAGLTSLSRQAGDRGLSGLEFACGIPGSVGGGVVMNAGAYDGEISDVFLSCICYSPGKKLFRVEKADADFSYRHARFLSRGETVLESSFLLKEGERDQIKLREEELLFKRRDKQPLEYPSAGSAFKRPEGYFAARLIDEAGLKGYSIGGAQVSEKHAGFIINRENATSAELLSLFRYVRESVLKASGVLLEPEVRYLGEEGELAI